MHQQQQQKSAVSATSCLAYLSLYSNFCSCHFFQALESQQCLGGKLTTVQFRREEIHLPGDFWAKGVDNSKTILETILDKIKSHELSELTWFDFWRDKFFLENPDDGENILYSRFGLTFYFSKEKLSMTRKLVYHSIWREDLCVMWPVRAKPCPSSS